MIQEPLWPTQPLVLPLVLVGAVPAMEIIIPNFELVLSSATICARLLIASNAPTQFMPTVQGFIHFQVAI